MTAQELRTTAEYISAVEKIKSYSIGYEFTLNFSKIPEAKSNALKIVIKDCIDMGILQNIGVGIDIQGDFCGKTYKRVKE